MQQQQQKFQTNNFQKSRLPEKACCQTKHGDRNSGDVISFDCCQHNKQAYHYTDNCSGLPTC